MRKGCEITDGLTNFGESVRDFIKKVLVKQGLERSVGVWLVKENGRVSSSQPSS